MPLNWNVWKHLHLIIISNWTFTSSKNQFTRLNKKTVLRMLPQCIETSRKDYIIIHFIVKSFNILNMKTPNAWWCVTSKREMGLVLELKCVLFSVTENIAWLLKRKFSFLPLLKYVLSLISKDYIRAHCLNIIDKHGNCKEFNFPLFW